MNKGELGFVIGGVVLGFVIGSWYGSTSLRQSLRSDREIIGEADTIVLCEALAGREFLTVEWLADWTLHAESRRACINQYAPQRAMESAPPLPPYLRHPSSTEVITLEEWRLRAEERIFETCEQMDGDPTECFNRDWVYLDAYVSWLNNRDQQAIEGTQ